MKNILMGMFSQRIIAVNQALKTQNTSTAFCGRDLTALWNATWDHICHFLTKGSSFAFDVYLDEVIVQLLYILRQRLRSKTYSKTRRSRYENTRQGQTLLCKNDVSTRLTFHGSPGLPSFMDAEALLHA